MNRWAAHALASALCRLAVLGGLAYCLWRLK